MGLTGNVGRCVTKVTHILDCFKYHIVARLSDTLYILKVICNWVMLMVTCNRNAKLINEVGYVHLNSKQYRFFKKNPLVQSPCNPRRTLAGFSWGCMVIVLKGSF